MRFWTKFESSKDLEPVFNSSILNWGPLKYGSDMCVLSHVWPFVTPRTIACQAPPPMEFSRQKCWSGLPFPSPGDLADPGIKPMSPVSPALAGRFFITTTTWEAPREWISLAKHPHSCIRQLACASAGGAHSGAAYLELSISWPQHDGYFQLNNSSSWELSCALQGVQQHPRPLSLDTILSHSLCPFMATKNTSRLPDVPWRSKLLLIEKEPVAGSFSTLIYAF